MSETPKVIKINGMRWTVALLDRIEMFRKTDEKLFGQCCPSENEVRIRSDVPPDRTRSVLWHEIFHAIEMDAGYDFAEEQVRAMSHGLFVVLRDNPQFVEWLLEEVTNE